MVADSNSQIAWHRAQIRKHRAALKQIETARHNFGEIAGSKTIAQSHKTVAELKRKIGNSERMIAAYERQTRRPLTTDLQTLASAPWSKWNGSELSGPAIGRRRPEFYPEPRLNSRPAGLLQIRPAAVLLTS